MYMPRNLADVTHSIAEIVGGIDIGLALGLKKIISSVLAKFITILLLKKY